MAASQYHVFALPASLLDSLVPRNLISQTPPRAESPPAPFQPPPSTSTATRTCNVCLGATFADVEAQRNHFRSDWHRYNVKLRMNGAQQVTEIDFAQLVDNLEESISGSGDSSEESDSDNSDAVATLMNNLRSKGTNRSSSPTSASRTIPQTAVAWFHSPPSTQIGVYRALFLKTSEPSEYVSELRDMQSGGETGRMWAMFMVAGGHFAGAVVRVSRPNEDDDEESENKKRKPKRPKPDSEVLLHKTFHRYTTRRKQGGSQSMNDNAKGPAKSAGALLRRYGEQSLREDIRGLINDWAEEINACERIFIRASGSNRKIFMDYDNCIITKSDPRLRTFPFPTRRPTQSELSRCLLELTRVKISHLTEEALRAQDEAYLASLPKPKPAPLPKADPLIEKPKAPVLSKEEELFREKWTRLLEMVQKGRLEPFKSFWEREGEALGGIDTTIPDWTGERRATILQVATRAGHEDMVKWILEDARANPTIEVPSAHTAEEEAEDAHHSDASDTAPVAKGARRTAYDLARTKGVRNIFRRCAAEHADWWDWLGAGHVPSVLSREMEEEQEGKKKVRRKGLKDRVREREAKEKEKEKDLPPSAEEPVIKPPKMSTEDITGPRKLGGSSGAADGIAGLTPEMRAKVERERRARAAEARMKALGRS